MEEKDYFSELVTINPPIIVFLILFVIGYIFSLFALYSIIWLEHFGSDSQRTIVNQLASGICWTFIQIILVPQLIDLIR
jgi:hypothetical protein